MLTHTLAVSQEQHSYPIFHEAWGADEELLLIEGLTLYGLGNWQDASEHVGTRTKEECQAHYMEVWVGTVEGSEESSSASIGTSGVERVGEKRSSSRLGAGSLSEKVEVEGMRFEIDHEVFLQRKKRRIEDMRNTSRGTFGFHFRLAYTYLLSDRQRTDWNPSTFHPSI